MTKQNDSLTIEVYRPGTPVVAKRGKSATIMGVRVEPDCAPDNYRIRYKVALWPEAPPPWWADQIEWLDPGEVRPIDTVPLRPVVYVVGTWASNSARMKFVCERIYFTEEEAEEYRLQRQEREPEREWCVMIALHGEDWSEWEQL